MDNRGIGVFDSGIGGLTVARRMMEVLPEENIVYFGDTLRVPYGNREKSELMKFSRQLAAFMNSRNVKLIVVACNTISSSCVNELREVCGTPLVEVLSPGVREVAASDAKNVGVAATETTIKFGAHKRLFRELRPDIEVYPVECPIFVPVTEENLAETPVGVEAARWYLQKLEGKIDTLVLGCTHYPLLTNAIKAVLPGVRVVDPAIATTDEIVRVLGENGLRAGEGSGRCDFYVSGDVKKFDNMAKLILGHEVSAEKVDIAQY